MSKNKLVVEIGSGHSPDTRSHILVDKDRSADSEREGPLKQDERPMVIAMGEALPFRTRSASLVVAHQVLEHSEDPGSFVEECYRVGEMVEVDTPSPLQELLFRDRSFHRWLVYLDEPNDQVLYWPINLLGPSGRTGEIFEALYERQGLVYSLVRGNPGAFMTRWQGKLQPKMRRGSGGELDNAIALLFERVTRGARAWHFKACGRAVIEVAKSRYREAMRIACRARR